MKILKDRQIPLLRDRLASISAREAQLPNRLLALSPNTGIMVRVRPSFPQESHYVAAVRHTSPHPLGG